MPQFYFDYLRWIKGKTELVKYGNVNSYLLQFALLKKTIDLLPGIVYILDYRTQKYLFLSENVQIVLGFTRDEFITMGQGLLLERIHPDDMAAISSKVFRRFMEYSRGLTEKELRNTKFSMNYRTKRKDGSYAQLLQQYYIIAWDKERNPLITLGLCTDITAYKTDSKVVFSVSNYNDKNGLKLATFSESTVSKRLNITRREYDVLKSIMDGLNSRQIAEKLIISQYTVRAHRRNLLDKTKCRNVAELCNYAANNGLI